MKAASILKNGLTGAATLTLLRETLDKADAGNSNVYPLHKKGVFRELKKVSHKKGLGAVKGYVNLAARLLGAVGYMGVTAPGRKKNTLLRGGILGALAGTAAILMSDGDDPTVSSRELRRKRVTTMALYILGGLVAGGAIKLINNGKKKSKKK